MEANEATQTHCYNPVTPDYPIWAYYAHGRQRRCQEDPVSPLQQTGEDNQVVPVQQDLKQHHLTLPKADSEPPSVEDDVNVWRYAILELHARNDDIANKFYH